MTDDERTDRPDGTVSRRTLLATAGALTGALGPGGLATPAGADGPDRRTRTFEFVGAEPNDFYVSEDWQERNADLGAGGPVSTVLMLDGYMGAGAYDHPVAPTSRDPPSHYVRVRDDALLAVDVLPDHPLLPDGWALTWASIRGTGCSSGEFDLFDDTHALDGCELLDWLGARPWANARVGLFGASYSGITALHVAQAYGRGMAGDDPRWAGHLTAVSANMVVGDLYRDITVPGGVPNAVFPAAWTKGVRPAAGAAGTVAGLEARDEICAQNLAHRSPKHPADDPLVWYTRRRDGPTWHQRSAIYGVDDIAVPTYVAHAWQDEQTGPRAGVAVYDALDPGPAAPPVGRGRGGPEAGGHEEPTLLRTTNGVHNTAGTLGILDAKPWFEYWLEGERTAELQDGRPVHRALADAPVVHHLGAETESLPGDRSKASFGGDGHYAVAASDVPDPDADWRRFALDEGGRLRAPGEGPGGGTAAYATGSPRQSWSFQAPEAGSEVALAEGPDVLTYRSAPFEEPTTVAGPINAVLHVTSTAPEMDLFVRVADQFVDETGATRVVPLQRGLVRASFRALDDRPPADPGEAVTSGRQTWHTAAGEIVRPYRPHTTVDPIVPGERYRYDVEVFPLVHTFRPGHRLVVRVHTPPASDGRWGYEPSRAPGVNVVHHDPGSQDVAGRYAPSSLFAPVVDVAVPAGPVDYGAYAGYRELGGYREPAATGLPGDPGVAAARDGL